MKQLIIDKLTEMKNIERANGQFFKVKAYNNVIKQLVNYEKDIHTKQDLDSAGFIGVGKGISEKIDQIIVTGTIKQVAEQKNTADVINVLCAVHGIGPVKAKELMKSGIKTIEDLRNNIDKLNKVQIIGLKYVDDIVQRIPREEMKKHELFLKDMINVPFMIAGSYRRGLKNSGDIDVIVKGTSSDIEALIESKYVADTLARGESKFMGVCRLPRHKKHRRIDLLVVDPNVYPFALLYFTGSKEHNIYLRNIALKKGYSLNEYGFTPVPNVKFDTECDIFTFLGLKYVEPICR
jgi:DNA polymerase beta